MNKILLEICAGSLASALAAAEGGADRVELCSALPLDGLTPGAGTLIEAKRLLSIPVHVLIRPREGNFVYSQQELKVICADIEAARDLGADGIVCGALDQWGNIDVAATEQMIKASQELPFTFHRAFDRCNNPLEAVRLLIEMGVNTLLTSGQAETAVLGKNLIKELVDTAWPKGLTVMPGAGINASNITPLAVETGARVIHLSAKKKMDGYDQTDRKEVKNCRKALDLILKP